MSTRFRAISSLFLLLIAPLILVSTAIYAQKKKKKTEQSASISPGILLAEKGQTRYRILLPSSPTAEERKVADDPEVLERVRIARLPLAYAKMEQAKKHFRGPGGVFNKVNGRWEARTDIRAMINPFTDLLIRQGVTQVKEWSTSPEEYRAALYRLLSQGMNEHLAYGKPVTFISPDTGRLPVEAATMLTDGIRGSHDYSYNWLAFSGDDLEVVIDLEQTRPVQRIESAYYQYAYWLRVLPKKVEYFLSSDGKTFDAVGTVENTLPIDQYGGQQRDFILEFSPRQARYIKVKAYTLGNTPAWHPGGGRAANMLIDEIVVE